MVMRRSKSSLRIKEVIMNIIKEIRNNLDLWRSHDKIRQLATEQTLLLEVLKEKEEIISMLEERVGLFENDRDMEH